MKNGVQFSPLRSGDVVAVIAPSGRAEDDVLSSGELAIRKAGFTPYIHPQCYERLGKSSLAGSDEARLESLHEVYADRAVKAILCARGGYGAPRIVASLDYKLIRKSPKPFVGYSDQTAILAALTSHTQQSAFLGPMLWGQHNLKQASSWKHLWQVLRGVNIQPTDHPAARRARVMVEGTATGRLLGGNLSLISARMGTSTMPDFKGAILVLEDVGEPLYRIDRMLVQLRDAGVFKAAKGIIVGDLAEVADETTGFRMGVTPRALLRQHFLALGVPVVTNFPCGHGQHHTVLPLGTQARLVASASGVSLTHEKVFCS
jgi:muramoyltetrapeptide carboxypeptidase